MPNLRGLTLALLLQTVVASSFVPRSSSVAKRPAFHPSNDSLRKVPGLFVSGGSEEVNPTPPEGQTPTEPVAPIETPVAPIETPTTSLLGPNASPPGFLRKLFPSFPWHLLPDYLTYARCLSIPLLVVLFFL